MGKRDPRVDQYISKAADFAKPILKHLRELVHAACPEVEEEMKWSAPHFMYRGMLCGMASFKSHCAFGFWKGSLVLGGKTDRTAAGQFGRVTAQSDLPSDRTVAGYIKKAMRLNDEGVTAPRKKPAAAQKELSVPMWFITALKRNKKALVTFDRFSHSHKREYVEWVTDARTEATRERRLGTALEWMAEGKSRNWKYVRSG